MAWPIETVGEVRQAYVVDRLPLEKAAEVCGVPEKTVRTWKRTARMNGDDWDRARAAHRLTGDNRQLLIQHLLEDYIAIHGQVQQAVREDVTGEPLKRAEALSRLADAFTKVMSAVGKASPVLNLLAVRAEVVAWLVGFVGERYPHQSGNLAEVLEAFGDWLATKK